MTSEIVTFKGSAIWFTFCIKGSNVPTPLDQEKLRGVSIVHLYACQFKYAGGGVLVTDMPVHLGTHVELIGIYENTPEFWTMADAHAHMQAGT